MNPDFVALAQSYGAHGHRVASAEEFGPLLAECLDAKGTHVIEVPFSYDWMSAKLDQSQKESHEIIETVEKEFGKCLIDCSHDPMEVEEAPAAASAKRTKASPAKKPAKAKRQKLVASKKDYIVKKGSSLPFYLGGDPVKPNDDLAVINKYNGEEFCRVALADESQVNKAIKIAAGVGAKKMRELPAYVRQVRQGTG